MALMRTPPDPDLQAEMATLADCQRAEGYACITARREHGASSVEIPPPQFAILLQGRKQVSTAQQSLTFVPGDSGATLRRRLASEQLSVRELIADARLAYAMQLLYTTRLPLKTVAARVGYRSLGSFNRRFAARYGLDPAEIGNS
jgi:methylphosphotriester-DNA--protein-cysteine methyltransferase